MFKYRQRRSSGTTQKRVSFITSGLTIKSFCHTRLNISNLYLKSTVRQSRHWTHYGVYQRFFNVDTTPVGVVAVVCLSHDNMAIF